MITITQRRNEYDLVVVDTKRVPNIEILIEHAEGEIWARIHGISRLCTKITLHTCDNEVDLKSEVLHDWIDNPTFRTFEDLQELREAMVAWEPAEPDCESIIQSRNEALAYDGPYA
jgi:hypothetical protein